MSLYRVGEVWYVDITPRQGPRIRRSTGTPDKAEAQRYHDELKADSWKRQRAGAYLSDALIAWLAASPRTNNERNAVKQFRALYPDRPISEITGPDIAAVLASKGPAHANRIANIVRAALNLAAQSIPGAGAAPNIPRRKAPLSRLRWLTRDEWGRLYDALPSHLKPMALFAVSTGLRSANVLGLKWDQVDMGRRVAWVDATEAKARKPIGVPLSDDAMRALAEVHGQHPEWVFTFRGRPVGSIKTAFGKALARAGLGHWEDREGEDGHEQVFVPNATWHDLRHTWASWHVQAGTPLPVLKELGGWASMDMVMRYSHLSPAHLAGWANNAGTSQFTTHPQPNRPESRTAPVAQWIEQPPPKG